MLVRTTIRIYLLLSLIFSIAFGLSQTTYVIYLRSLGLDPLQINLVNTFFFLANVIFEVPTGAIADRYGRKVSTVFSGLLIAVGLMVYGFAIGFWTAVLAEVILAIGKTCQSGAFEAWVVDRIRSQGFTGDLTQVFRRERMIDSVGALVGGLVGAWVSITSLRSPWIIGGGLAFVFMVGCIWLMVEDREFERPRDVASDTPSYCAAVQYEITKVMSTMKSGARSVHSSSQLTWLLTINCSYACALMTPNMSWQPVLEHAFPLGAGLGIVWVGIRISLILGNILAAVLIARKHHHETTLTMCLWGIAVAILLAGLAELRLPVALILFFAHEVWRGIFDPTHSAAIHERVTNDKERATIISYYSLWAYAVGAVGLIIGGFIMKYCGYAIAWIISGLVLIAAARWHMRSWFPSKDYTRPENHIFW